jgi:hypothetical protein
MLGKTNNNQEAFIIFRKCKNKRLSPILIIVKNNEADHQKILMNFFIFYYHK